MFDAWEAEGSKFKGATEGLAKTWKGLMSMFGDAWFSFRNMVADSGIWDYMKGGASDLLEKIQELRDNGTLAEWAGKISDAIIGAGEALREFAESVDWKFWATEAVKALKVVYDMAKKAYRFYRKVVDWASKFTVPDLGLEGGGDVLIDFKGKGSSVKPLGEKIDEMKDKFTSFTDLINTQKPVYNVEIKANRKKVDDVINSIKGNLPGFTISTPNTEPFIRKIVDYGPSGTSPRWRDMPNPNYAPQTGKTYNVNISPKYMVGGARELKRELEEINTRWN